MAPSVSSVLGVVVLTMTGEREPIEVAQVDVSKTTYGERRTDRRLSWTCLRSWFERGRGGRRGTLTTARLRNSRSAGSPATSSMVPRSLMNSHSLTPEGRPYVGITFRYCRRDSDLDRRVSGSVQFLNANRVAGPEEHRAIATVIHALSMPITRFEREAVSAPRSTGSIIRARSTPSCSRQTRLGRSFQKLS